MAITNIIGEGFPDEIIKQVQIRQQKKGKKERNNENLVWQTSNTGWVKLISSVDVNAERYTILQKLNSNIPTQEKSSLAKEFVLMGGVYDQNTGILHQGIARDNSTLNNAAYGLGGSKEFGLQPMPGITSFNIKTETRGSLKTATIGIKAYNRTQFDIINMLYMSLGYSVLVEWGNTMYYENDGTWIYDNQFSLADDFLAGKYKYSQILPIIQQYRLQSNGNYDAALCKVVNFTWSIDKNLIYNITITLRTIGDIIESLKTNTLSGNIKLDTVIDQTALNNALKDSIQTQLNVIDPSTGKPFTTQQLSDPAYRTSIQQAKQSLIKPKTLPPATSTPPSTLTSTTPAWASSSDIGKLLYLTQLQIDQQPKSSVNDNIRLWNNEGTVDALSIDFRGTKVNPTDRNYYVRLGYFLNLLQVNILAELKNNTSLKIINIFTDVKNNIIATYDRQVSADPSVCMFKTEWTFPNSPNKTILPGAEDFKKSFPPSTYSYGYFMNVYFNIQYIINEFTRLYQSSKEGKVVLIDFLQIFSKGFCKSTGNYNKIEPVVDEDFNIIKYVDEIPLSDRDSILKIISPGVSTTPVEFQIFGYKQIGNDTTAGIVRDLNFTTTVTPDLASMITVGAQANGYITGQDSTALSTLNNGLTDRIKEEFVTPLEPKTSDNTKPDLNTKYKEVIDSFNYFIKDLAVDPSNPGQPISFNPDVINKFLNSNTQFAEYDQYVSTQEKKKTNPDASSAIIGFIPFNLSLTIDGLSGIKIYQKFTISSEFLPSNYPQSLEFIIKGITNEIKDNQWITIIESLAIPSNPFSTKVVRQKTPNNFVASNSSVIDKINADKIYKFFISKGFTPFQAAGFVGNFNQESRLDPTTTNSIGAIGLAQWLGARKTNLLQQPNPYSLDTQLNFVWTELTTTEKSAYNKIKATTNIKDATIAIRQYYERSNPSEANDDARIKYALNVLNQENNNIA
jgi:hypothetical protein